MNETISETPTDHDMEPDLPNNAPAMQLIDALLKTPTTLYQHIEDNDFSRYMGKLFLTIGLCLLIYGLIIGSFSGGAQWLAAPLKVLFGTLLSALLCFPSLYIFSALSGADLHPSQLLGLLLSALTLGAVLLIGFAPVAFIFTFSIQALPFMGAIHLAIWACSLYFGLRYLVAGLTQLGATNRLMIKIWAVILILTLCQMSTTLRPILGEADTWLSAEKRFFLEHWLEWIRK